MRRLAVVLGLCALLFPAAAWADDVNFIVNEFGSVSLTSAGIVSTGSELVYFLDIGAPSGHSLGSVYFSTGAFTTGSVLTGGTLSSTGSIFDVVGRGPWVKNGRETLFSGSFIGPIHWKLVTQTGQYQYVFKMSGEIEGMLFTGREVIVPTRQIILVNQKQWLNNHRGNILMGKTDFRLNIPEPGTLGLGSLGIGMIVLATAIRRKLWRT
ncbi:MAG: PEP-CTERM sorting domain-containing protein [Terriglobales bacterium]